jgi:lysophospholipase L1-like esterase
MAKWFSGLLALFLSTSVCLGLVEVLFRTVLSESNLKPKEWSDRPSYYYVPEGAKTLQDRPHSPQKAPNTFRIAVVGDSFSFAPYMQFDDTFAKRLERMLNLNSSSLHAEVINYGVPRYSTSHEVAVTEKAIAEQADLVILQICLNDPEIKPYHPTGLIGGVVDRFGGIDYTEGLLSWWKTGAFVAKRLYNSKSQRDYVEYFNKLWKGEKTRKNFVTAFRKIKSTTDAAKIPVVGVVFPLVGLPMDDNYPFSDLHQGIQQICEGEKVPCLDLLESYRGLPIERIQVIVRKDFHPNEIGHRIAAESLYTFLEAKDLVPVELKIKQRVPERIGIRLTGE